MKLLAAAHKANSVLRAATSRLGHLSDMTLRANKPCASLGMRFKNFIHATMLLVSIRCTALATNIHVAAADVGTVAVSGDLINSSHGVSCESILSIVKMLCIAGSPTVPASA